MNFSLRTLFFSFNGRINRATYWTRAFPVLLAWGVFVNAVHVSELQMLGMQGLVSVTLSLLGLWPSLAVTVKRLHDRGRSGWFLLIFLIPVLGPIWLLIEIWFLPGDQDTNRFGDSPQDKGLPLQWVVPFEVVGVAAIVSLLVWTFVFSVDSEQFFVGDTEPIFIRLTFMNDIPKQVISSVYKKFEIEALELPEVKNIDAQVGAAPEGRADLARWYSSELMVQIALHEEWQTKVAKAELVARVEKLFHYPGLKIKFVKTVERPIPEFIPRTYTAIEFSPDQTILKELNIDQAYLSEELAVLLRLAPEVFRAEDLLNLYHPTLEGILIPLGAIVKFNTVEVELDLGDLKPGSWQAINSAEKRMEGYLIEISLDHLQAFGLSIVKVEKKVKSALEIIQGSIDQQSLGSIPLVKLSGNTVLLRDIATVDRVNELTKPQGEEGKRYQLIWTGQYR